MGVLTYYYCPQMKFGARLYFQKHVSRILSMGRGVPGPGGCLILGVLGPGGAWCQKGCAWSWGAPGWGVSGPEGGSSGPQPRGKLKGIWSRPTTKGKFEGDLVQAHTQGGSWGELARYPLMATAAGSTYPTGIHSCFANFLPKTA